jgi:hypothetical protein
MRERRGPRLAPERTAQTLEKVHLRSLLETAFYQDRLPNYSLGMAGIKCAIFTDKDGGALGKCNWHWSRHCFRWRTRMQRFRAFQRQAKVQYY